MSINANSLLGEIYDDISEKIGNFKGKTVELHVLIDMEDDLYTAHCLDFDIVVDGKTLENVKKSILKSIVNYISFSYYKGTENKLFRHAPSEYWAKYREAKSLKSIQVDEEFKLGQFPLPFFSNVIKEVEFGRTVQNV